MHHAGLREAALLSGTLRCTVCAHRSASCESATRRVANGITCQAGRGQGVLKLTPPDTLLHSHHHPALVMAFSKTSGAATPHRTTRPASDAIDLEDRFHVSRSLGFLPPPLPVQFADERYYAPWLELVLEGNLADLLQNDRLDERIQSLPLLTTDRLRGVNEWRRAHSVLAFLVAAWVWGGTSGPKDVRGLTNRHHIAGPAPPPDAPISTASSTSSRRPLP